MDSSVETASRDPEAKKTNPKIRGCAFSKFRKENLTNHGASEGDEEDEDVSAEGVVVGTVALAEESETRVEVVPGESLNGTNGQLVSYLVQIDLSLNYLEDTGSSNE